MRYVLRLVPEREHWLPEMTAQIVGLEVARDVSRNAMETFLLAMLQADADAAVHLEDDIELTPVMTGGVGGDELARFYAHHFIPKCPVNFKLTPISRTIGADRLVDEMLVSFTHDVEIDWMLPGVPPTGKYVEVPTVAIVNFRGDKLYHEHIYWDQASVLMQIGLLEPAGLPVAGVETAKKLVERDASVEHIDETLGGKRRNPYCAFPLVSSVVSPALSAGPARRDPTASGSGRRRVRGICR